MSELEPIQRHSLEDISDISANVFKSEPHYFAVGEISDVYRCRLVRDGGEQVVAVKVMRGLVPEAEVKMRLQKDIVKLVLQWKELSHPNLMPCFGTCYHLGHLTGLVFPICSNGTIVKHLERRPISQKLDMLYQVASAVKYLHSRDFVHADIRGANILIRDDTPLLMDGGLAPLVGHGNFTVSSICGRPRWTAPEILDPPEELMEDVEEEIPYTAESDVYALGMTILEVITGKIPFSHRRYDAIVMLDVIRGIRPNRPQDPVIPDSVWDVVTSCWEKQPEDRPSAALVESWLNVARLTGKALFVA